MSCPFDITKSFYKVHPSEIDKKDEDWEEFLKDLHEETLDAIAKQSRPIVGGLFSPGGGAIIFKGADTTIEIDEEELDELLEVNRAEICKHVWINSGFPGGMEFCKFCDKDKEEK